MFCSNCGVEVNETNKFCSGCGAPIESRKVLSENSKEMRPAAGYIVKIDLTKLKSRAKATVLIDNIHAGDLSLEKANEFSVSQGIHTIQLIANTFWGSRRSNLLTFTVKEAITNLYVVLNAGSGKFQVNKIDIPAQIVVASNIMKLSALLVIVDFKIQISDPIYYSRLHNGNSEFDALSQSMKLAEGLIVFLGVLLTFFIITKIYSRKNWARTLCLILLGLSIIVNFANPEFDYLDGILLLADIIATGLLYTSKSSKWFQDDSY